MASKSTQYSTPQTRPETQVSFTRIRSLKVSNNRFKVDKCSRTPTTTTFQTLRQTITCRIKTPTKSKISAKSAWSKDQTTVQDPRLVTKTTASSQCSE